MTLPVEVVRSIEALAVESITHVAVYKEANDKEWQLKLHAYRVHGRVEIKRRASEGLFVGQPLHARNVDAMLAFASCMGEDEDSGWELVHVLVWNGTTTPPDFSETFPAMDEKMLCDWTLASGLECIVRYMWAILG